MLNHHKLLIDQDCPMCRAYGQCFTNLNLVDAKTLAPYQTIEEQYANRIDMDRARNEIALFDGQTNKTVYGYDALVAIITQQASFLKSFLNLGPVKWIFTQLYYFISYNRKVIVPAQPSGARNCTPDVQPFYRWAYIGIVALLTGYILNQLVYCLAIELGQPFSPYREYVVCIAQVAWQYTAISFIVKEKRLTYLGNMSTVSMIGGLLLIPVLMIYSAFSLPVLFLIGSFFAVVTIMLIEHIRRCKLLEIPLTMTYSWIIFRTFVLFIIILFAL